MVSVDLNTPSDGGLTKITGRVGRSERRKRHSVGLIARVIYVASKSVSLVWSTDSD